jgi:hypothetical protein
VGTVSARVALLLGVSSAWGGVSAAFILAAVGRGPRSSGYVLLAHHYSCAVVPPLAALGILAFVLGRRTLAVWALLVGVGAWVFASCLVPMADATPR